MTKEEQSIEDVEFIFREVQRFALMSPSEVIRHLQENRDDTFATLSRIGGGILFCGRAAYDRFNELADRTIKPGSREAKTFDQSDYVRALRASFVEEYIEAGKAVNQSSVKRMETRAKHIASEGLVNVTHHIPCALFYEHEPEVFTVGPVSFTRVEKFLDDLGPAINAYHGSSLESFADGLRKRRSDLSTEEVQAEASSFVDMLDKKIRSYYLAHDWVASVTIPMCHAALSKSRAERTVDAALDVLRLFVSSHPERFRRANSPNAPYETSELITDQNGRVHATLRQGGRGAAAGNGWYAALIKDADPLWSLFERAIDALRAGEKSDELNQRLLDAINWFGQAVVEPNPAAKVVKYTAALERLTMTRHLKSGIEALIIKRVSLLNNERIDKTLHQIEKDLGNLYQRRSDLMHGSMSPYSPAVTDVLQAAWDVTRWAILVAAQFFAHLRAGGLNTRKDLDVASDAWAGGENEMTISDARWLLNQLEDPFTMFPIESVADTLFGAVDEAEMRKADLVDSWEVARKFWSVEAEHYHEEVGLLVGAIFVLGQAAITQTVSILKALRNHPQVQSVIPESKEGKLVAYAATEITTKLSKIVIIDAVSNYFKHVHEWPKQWNDVPAKDSQTKKTIGIVLQLGMKPGEMTDNLLLAANQLGLCASNPRALASSIQEWREDWAKELYSSLGLQDPNKRV